MLVCLEKLKKKNNLTLLMYLVFLVLLTTFTDIVFLTKGFVPLVFAILIVFIVVNQNIYYKDKGMRAINY